MLYDDLNKCNDSDLTSADEEGKVKQFKTNIIIQTKIISIITQISLQWKLMVYTTFVSHGKSYIQFMLY